MKPISKIGELRERAGITQRQLSIEVGVTENTIQNWEKGRAVLEQIKRLIRLCKVLDCKLEDLIEYDISESDLEKPLGQPWSKIREKGETNKPEQTSQSTENSKF
ncbi:MAG: helix-turn-helix transcriptional regulator [Kamptonema sp. SIO1D9]|nr:helix-turn-helix transcriptional regulator [Kamptonema sp. SIO1D9]